MAGLHPTRPGCGGVAGTRRDFDFVIVNDGSTDGSAEILRLIVGSRPAPLPP